MVEWNGLENRHTERYLGFESLSFRNLFYMMLEFQKPIPVLVEGKQDGYAIYVTEGGTLENDIWCVVLCEGGIVRHYRSDQIRIFHNATFDIVNDNKL